MKQIQMSPAKVPNLRKAGKVLLALVVLFLLASMALPQAQDVASAQSGDGYDLSWWTVDGGGGTTSESGSGYTLIGTAGQPDASALTDGSYTLVGGFWQGGAAAEEYKTYLPLLLKNYQ